MKPPSSNGLRYKILVVDDEADTLAVLKDLLRQDGFSVLLARSAREALLAAVDSHPDLILSDVVMPETDGLKFCRTLRSDARTARIPIILISGAMISEREQLSGLERGADDYLVRPYPHSLLVAKIRAVLRRYEAPEALSEVLETTGITLDVAARSVEVSRKRIALTPKEFDLLTLMMRKPGRVLSVPYLLETVWGYDPAEYNDPATVQSHISTLRRKLGPALGRRIRSVPRLGYRFEAASPKTA